MSVVVVTEARLAALVLGREPFVTGQHLLCPLPTGLYVLVGAGALMMAVGFFGCCGATRESQCVLGSVSGERWGGTWPGAGHYLCPYVYGKHEKKKKKIIR